MFSIVEEILHNFWLIFHKVKKNRKLYICHVQFEKIRIMNLKEILGYVPEQDV